jgi:integrative and conjugative element protein (TIGR02256 family)
MTCFVGFGRYQRNCPLPELSFVSNDGRFALQIPAEHVQTIERLAADSRANETGGVLLGYYTPNLDKAVVTFVTPAPTDSRSGRTWFRRGTEGLQAVAQHRWRSKREFYIGEWHLHPYAPPTPSGDDAVQMSKIASDLRRRCPEPILLIIGGHPGQWSFSATVYPRGRAPVRLRQSN